MKLKMNHHERSPWHLLLRSIQSLYTRFHQRTEHAGFSQRIVPIIIAFIIIGAGIFFLTKGTNKSADIKSVANGEVIYYYGEGCPHCAVVADYISQNKIDEKIKIEKKEVWNSEPNATEMKATAKTCNISESDIGVPLMFDKSTSKCYIGDTEVNNFLKTKL